MTSIAHDFLQQGSFHFTFSFSDLVLSERQPWHALALPPNDVFTLQPWQSSLTVRLPYFLASCHLLSRLSERWLTGSLEFPSLPLCYCRHGTHQGQLSWLCQHPLRLFLCTDTMNINMKYLNSCWLPVFFFFSKMIYDFLLLRTLMRDGAQDGLVILLLPGFYWKTHCICSV